MGGEWYLKNRIYLGKLKVYIASRKAALQEQMYIEGVSDIVEVAAPEGSYTGEWTMLRFYRAVARTVLWTWSVCGGMIEISETQCLFCA